MRKLSNFINEEPGIETLKCDYSCSRRCCCLLIYGAGWGGSIENTLINAAKSTTTAIL